jgi:hypothetical protein
MPPSRAWGSLRRLPGQHRRATPTSASWLNQVERWFATLTQKYIRPGTHRSTRQLEQSIRHCIKVNNEDPKLFVWCKTANDILASAERLVCELLTHDASCLAGGVFQIIAGPAWMLGSAQLRGGLDPATLRSPTTGDFLAIQLHRHRPGSALQQVQPRAPGSASERSARVVGAEVDAAANSLTAPRGIGLDHRSCGRSTLAPDAGALFASGSSVEIGGEGKETAHRPTRAAGCEGHIMSMMTFLIIASVLGVVGSLGFGIAAMAHHGVVWHRTSAQWMTMRVAFQALALVLVVLVLST